MGTFLAVLAVVSMAFVLLCALFDLNIDDFFGCHIRTKKEQEKFERKRDQRVARQIEFDKARGNPYLNE